MRRLPNLRIEYPWVFLRLVPLPQRRYGVSIGAEHLSNTREVALPQIDPSCSAFEQLVSRLLLLILRINTTVIGESTTVVVLRHPPLQIVQSVSLFQCLDCRFIDEHGGEVILRPPAGDFTCLTPLVCALGGVPIGGHGLFWSPSAAVDNFFVIFLLGKELRRKMSKRSYVVDR